jgi:dipeptidyl aminopeptidase/acylaminoacyl peptidase
VLSVVTLPLAVALGCTVPSRAQPSDIRQRYERAERFGSKDMSALVYKTGVQAHWIGDTPRFWYRNDLRDGREFILVDAEKGIRRRAFDHTRLAVSLSQATGEKYTPLSLPFRSIELDDDAQVVTFTISSGVWQCHLGSYLSWRLEDAGKRDAEGADDAEQKEKRESGLSPDGKWVAFVKEHDLYIRPKDGDEETQLSTEGEEGNAFGAIFWSPDSKRLVAYRTRPGARREMHLIESSPKDDVRPRTHQHVYALPGDKLDRHQMWLFDVESRAQTRVDTEPTDWGGPPRPRWRPDGRHFTFERTHRGYQRVHIVEVDSDSGKTRTVIDERSDTFVPPQKKMVRYLDDTDEIIWASERDGWNHLYLYDARTGRVKQQITRGEWVVRGIEHLDEESRQITFRGSGREKGQDPYLIHYYRIGLDGTGLVRLTEGNGHHSVKFSPDRGYLIDTYSRVDMAPVTELRRAADGSRVCKLEEADVRSLLKTGWRWPEPFAAKGRDGKTDIHGVMFRPSRLDRSKQYPVLESIYAGPQSSFVPKTFSARRGQQALAELGFIVVQIDGMGTSNRSKAFHDVAHKNLGDGGFPDRIAWLRAAARKYPYMDLSRVGVYGHSAGGYNAARALIAHGDFYKVAAAMSGNHDHRTDKVWWNELWMGYPVGDHYRKQSNVTQAHRLQGKLLLVHGELDRNVNPHAATMQFVNALIKANKDFDMLIVPGAGHGSGAYVKRRMWDYFVTHLLGIAPPREYEFKGPATGAEINITIRNNTKATVAVYWINFEGKLQRYHDMEPGGELKQHTFVGHEWVAEIDGRRVSTYEGSGDDLVWEIEPSALF